MATAQEVIKNFMKTLSKSSLVGEEALDEATRASSDFKSWQDVIDNMLKDCESYNGNATKFLWEKCGINLKNSDTGAITGYDAGNGIVKTYESIIEEEGPLVYPTTSYSTFSGLKVNWPDKSTLSEQQQFIVAALNSWWIPKSLELINESFDMNFQSSDTKIKEISIRFPDDSSFPEYAQASSTASYSDTKDSNGVSKVLSLSIDFAMKYYKDISLTDPNGAVGNNFPPYVDGTIAHELTHGIVDATLYAGNRYLPKYFTEGLADLTRGSDQNSSTMMRLASDPSQLNEVLQYNIPPSNRDKYAGGFMLLRYFAFQASNGENSPVKTYGADIAYVKPATAHDAMKRFMATLNNSPYMGVEGLDEAVRSTSKFSSWHDAIDKMVSDCASYNGDYEGFLREKCGIVFGNSDMGAITGSDAGGETVKNRESIIPEEGSLTYPTSSSATFSEITFHYPEGELTDAQKFMVGALHTWWIPNSLKLFEESYGINLEDFNTKVKDVTINFIDDDSKGAINRSSNNGKWTLSFNMKYFSDISTTDYNGKSSSYNYLDTSIASDIVRILNDFGEYGYPNCFRNGLGELTIGGDRAKSGIQSLASDSTSLSSALQDDSTGAGTAEAGYMLLRYIAKQAASDESSSAADTLVVNDDNSLLTSTGNESLILIANGTGDTLDGGTNGTDDTLISAGSGKKTTFFLHQNGGGDIVQNFDFGSEKGKKDVIAVDTAFSTFKLITPENGKVTIGSESEGSLTMEGTAAQNEFVYNYGGNIGIASVDMSSDSKYMKFVKEANFHIGQGEKTTLVFTSADSIESGVAGNQKGLGWATPYISEGLGTIDASAGHVGAVLGSNDLDQTIIVSKSKDFDEVWGGGGLDVGFSNGTNDTIVGSGNGNTVYYVGHKMGNDVLQNATAGDKVVFIDTKTTDIDSFKGTSKEFSASFKNGTTIKLSAAENITSSNTITVQFDDVTYNWNGSNLTARN